MKKIVLCLMLAFLGVAACKKETAEPEIEFGTDVSKLSLRKSAQVKASGVDLSVTLKEVNDSRCPINANCISAGQADLTFDISDGNNTAEVKVVFIGIGRDSGVSKFKLGAQLYAIKVSEVLPFPIGGTQPKPEEQEVSLVLTKI